MQVSILSLDEIIETLTDAVSTSYGQGSKIDSSMNIEHGKNGTKDDGGNVDEGSSITKQLLRQILIKPIPARFN